MGIERNRDILFWSGRKTCSRGYVGNCEGMQLVLPNPTTLAIPATVGLVHSQITLPCPALRAWKLFNFLFRES
jgi:hypothetical protein